MATAGPAQLASNVVYPNGMSQAQWQAAFTNSAVGGGNPYAPSSSNRGPLGPPMTPEYEASLGASTAPTGPQPAAGGIGIDGFGPIMSNYLRQFNASIGKSRANVDAMLHQTLGELAGRRDSAAKIVAGMPAEIGVNTHAGQAALGSDASDAALGLRAGAAGQARIGPAQLQANMAQDAAGAVPAAKYLGLANQANYDTGSTALNQQAFAANQALDEQQRNFEQELHLKQLDSKMANDQFYAHTKYQHDLNAADAQHAHDQQLSDQSDAAAKAAGLDSAQQLTDLQRSAAYKYAVESMTGGIYNTDGPSGDSLPGPLGLLAGPADMQGASKGKLSGADIAKKYSSNVPLLYALVAGGHLSLGDLVAAGVAAPPPGTNPLAGK